MEFVGRIHFPFELIFPLWSENPKLIAFVSLAIVVTAHFITLEAFQSNNL